MKGIELTAFDLAQRFIGLKEVAGPVSDPQVLAMLQLDDVWPADDSVPWCSAFVNYICWLLRLPRSKSLAARSWLTVGRSIPIPDAQVGFDVVVLTRGTNPQAGHVGLFAGLEWQLEDGHPHSQRVQILGGNQSNGVSVAPFPVDRIVGVRRLLEVTP